MTEPGARNMVPGHRAQIPNGPDAGPFDRDHRQKEEKSLDKALFISKNAIECRVNELAREIALDYGEDDPLVIGVLNGSVFFFADLVRALNLPCSIDFVRAASYGMSMNSSGCIRLTKEPEIPLEGRRVLLVEDIVDTGHTISMLLETLKSKHPRDLRVCVLIDKQERREVDVPIDYYGFKVQKGFLVGYGLDYAEQYRHLPEIFTLHP